MSTVALEGPELVLLSPGTANAPALSRSGSERVYRSEPGQRDDLFFQDDADTVDVSGHDVGDEPVHCACACSPPRPVVAGCVATRCCRSS